MARARFGVELAVNLLLPWITYRLVLTHGSEFAATAWSAAPPAVWSLAELLLHRRLDALSMLVLGGIALSLAALLFGGSPRLLLVRENLFTVPIGLLFLVSMLMKKPLIYYAARATFARQDPAHAVQFEAAWQRPEVVRGLRMVSLVWGLGLTVQGLLLGFMAWTWPVERFVALSPVIGYGIVALLGLWTWWYRNASMRRHAAGSA